jgi:hypothetical protein
MAVEEDLPEQRDVAVTFTAQFASYFAGEVAYSTTMKRRH